MQMRRGVRMRLDDGFHAVSLARVGLNQAMGIAVNAPTRLVDILSSGEMLPRPVFEYSTASELKLGTVLLLASTARIVTATGTPATRGEAIGSIKKWGAAVGSTEMPAGGKGVMFESSRSLAVMVWVPTV